MIELGDNIGEYMLAKQVGNRAFFARVAMEVSSSSNGSNLIVSIDPAIESRWHSAVSFGIEYAWELLVREITIMPSVAVRVISVDWQPADSTMMTVAFASANALWEALKFRPARTPQLDVSSGTFIFPN